MPHQSAVERHPSILVFAADTERLIGALLRGAAAD
jgi:hypothetical protein